MSDMLFGVIVTILFLIFVFALGFLITSFKNRRFTKAWSPLIPLIGGKVIADGGGAASSWLSGTYRGQPVVATMVPNRNVFSGETGHSYNSFDVALREVPGKQDWKLEYKTPILGFGQEGWKIEADDPALRQRLQAAGLLDLVLPMGIQTLQFTARNRHLQLHEDVTPLWIPPPERFQQELEFLLAVARINAEVNPA